MIIKKIYTALQSTLVTYPQVRYKFAKFVANVYHKHHIRFYCNKNIRVEPEIAMKCLKVLV